jgi:cardiolipin synthase (CMP-forming)
MRVLPNLLTLSRLLIAPLVALWILGGSYGQALGWLIAAGITDGLDGWIARRFGWSSRFGAMLDPIADKVLLVTVYVSMGIAGLVPQWLVWLVVGRDVLILGFAGAALLLTTHRNFSPSPWGKLSTLLQIFTGLFAIGSHAFGGAFLESSAHALVFATAAATVWSGIDYGLRAGRRWIDEPGGQE